MAVILNLFVTFDMMNHTILLEMLESQFGATDSELKWFGSYLRPRSSKVHIGDEYSESQQLSFSVPQESYSGANIFTSYIINKVVPDLASINGFADNHSL